MAGGRNSAAFLYGTVSIVAAFKKEWQVLCMVLEASAKQRIFGEAGEVCFSKWMLPTMLSARSKAQ